MTPKHKTREYKVYHHLEHWKRSSVILPPSKLFDTKNRYYPLFSYIYAKTKKFYGGLPLRKNGEKAFIHPVNVILILRMAHVDDPVTLCGGLLHDYVEETVDIYRKKHELSKTKKQIDFLDEYADVILNDLNEDLTKFCLRNSIEEKIVDDIISVIELLTRYKKNYYYKSICTIFTHRNKKEKERAIQIKLSDRMHNILSIECFTEPQRIYQCFKNIFILNNVKKYITEVYGKMAFERGEPDILIHLFKRCAKATYDAFFEIMLLCRKKGINDVVSMLQLAFKKFELEKAGLLKITRLDKKEVHPLGLYTGVVQKYNLRLHHNDKEFDTLQERSSEYYRRFFADFKFTEEQIKAIVDYKDSYALREVVAHLLYLPGYVLSGFDYSKMFCEMK